MSDSFVINYHKRTKNEFKDYFKNELHGIEKLQLYNPIYSSFFKLSKRNFNSITLNHKYHIRNLDEVYDNHTSNVIKKKVFIKYSPLLDPMKYMTGKYGSDDPSIVALPKYSSTPENCHPKLLCVNNASYVDNFFYFLSSVLLNHHKFFHGTDYYGSFLGIQNKFKFNITDDFDYVTSSTFFIENNGKLFFSENFTMDNDASNEMTRKNKLCIEVGDNIDMSIDIQASEISNTFDDVSCNPVQLPSGTSEDFNLIEEIDISEIYVDDTTDTLHCDNYVDSDTDNSDTNYSTTSFKDIEGEDEKDEHDEQNEEDEQDDQEEYMNDDVESTMSTASFDSRYTNSEDIFAYIDNFPVQMICMEECENTLDSLFEEGNVDDKIGASLFFQIVMTLLAYQKVFNFTHNDLHSNNIMYTTTSKKFLWYRYNKITYKVPTYGRLIKIIDFGRSIYKFQGKTFCSDSFFPDGDGESQYNCEPFFDESKKRVDPNYSFDLCRLGCSLYSFVDDSEFYTNNMRNIRETITRWITDDNNYNILYKKNGDERYKGFKLYKMIARTVTSHTPERQLEFDLFKQFKVNGKIKHIRQLMNLDTLPTY